MIIEERDWDILKSGDLSRIQESPDVLIGKPVLYGTRISITQVLLNLTMTGSVSETTRRLQEIVPSILEADILAALRFAAVVCDRRLLDRPGIRAENLAIAKTDDADYCIDTNDSAP